MNALYTLLAFLFTAPLWAQPQGYVVTRDSGAPLGVTWAAPSSGGVTSVTGTTNQITVSGATGDVTFSTPQNIDTAATPQFGRLGLGAAADATAQLGINAAIAATSTPGAILATTSTATSGSQKWSPGLDFTGSGWKTNSMTGPLTVRSRFELVPIQGAANPDPYLDLSIDPGSGTFTKAWRIGLNPQGTTQFGLWPGNVTPSSSNYSFATTSSGIAVVNGVSGQRAALRVNDAAILEAYGNSITIYQPLYFNGTGSLILKYGDVSTAGRGVGAIFASVSSTSQTASIAAANLQVGGAVAPAGLYRVSVYAVYTTTGAAAMSIDLGWSDPGQAQTKNLVAALSGAAKNFHESSTVIRADGVANITYATTVTGRTTDVYAIYVTLERLQ